MSSPRRYDVECGDEGYRIFQSLGGEWVKWQDYAALEAKYDRVKKMLEDACHELGMEHRDRMDDSR